MENACPTRTDGFVPAGTLAPRSAPVSMSGGLPMRRTGRATGSPDPARLIGGKGDCMHDRRASPAAKSGTKRRTSAPVVPDFLELGVHHVIRPGVRACAGVGAVRRGALTRRRGSAIP